MSSEMGKLLDKVAISLMEAIQDLVPNEGEQSAPISEGDFMRVLRRELLPLLEAGEALRQQNAFSVLSEKQRVYDAAKKAVLG